MQQGEFAIDPADEEFSDTVFTIDTLIQFEAEFVGIDRAIEALQKGTYGHCEVCSTAIAQDRLRHDPVLVRCDAHFVRETPALFTTEAEAPAPAADTIADDVGVLFGASSGFAPSADATPAHHAAGNGVAERNEATNPVASAHIPAALPSTGPDFTG